MRTQQLWLPLLLSLVGIAQQTNASLQSHDSIRAAAKEHTFKQFGDSRDDHRVTVGHLDSRLRLSNCSKKLEAFSPPGRRNKHKQTVGVRCSGAEPWTLYVPVTVSTLKKILVAERELPRGSIVTREDISLQERDVAALHKGYLEIPEKIIGHTLKRSLHKNDVITPGQLLIPHTVKRGSQVTILAKVGALQVRMNGKALSDGSKGEQIPVLNNSSKRQIEAIVIAPGIVEVSM